MILNKEINLISVSGGKDSTALALLALERGVENPLFVFADTGHENEVTYEYLQYLDGVLKERCGVGITTVRASFDEQIEGKRKFVSERWFDDLARGKPGKWVIRDDWRKEAEKAPDYQEPASPAQPEDVYALAETDSHEWVPAIAPKSEQEATEKVERTLAVLKPTGNPMLDLSIWKGRFASTRARFCSEELKHKPINALVQRIIEEQSPKALISWQGVRREESLARQNLLERDVEFGQWEPEPSGFLIYRPILDWKVAEVFDMHRRHGVKWNPLYEQGRGRVGCDPCIHARKDEIRHIVARNPETIDRMERWEEIVSDASKRDCSTFMDARVTAKFLGTGTRNTDINVKTHGIRTYAEWATTSRGGRQYDLLNVLDVTDPAPSCSSLYGLCE